MATRTCPYCGRELVEVDNPIRPEFRHRRGEEVLCPGPATDPRAEKPGLPGAPPRDADGAPAAGGLRPGGEGAALTHGHELEDATPEEKARAVAAFHAAAEGLTAVRDAPNVILLISKRGDVGSCLRLSAAQVYEFAGDLMQIAALELLRDGKVDVLMGIVTERTTEMVAEYLKGRDDRDGG